LYGSYAADPPIDQAVPFDNAAMDTATSQHLSFDNFFAETSQSPARPAQLSQPGRSLWPVVGYIALEDAERAAIFKATAWGEFPR
jgi:hypothetical protein